MIDLKKASDAGNLKKIHFWDRLLLRMVKPQRVVYEGEVFIFKIMFGKTYLLERYFEEPKHFNCRCTMVELRAGTRTNQLKYPMSSTAGKNPWPVR